jgi:hypothetical protein
MKRISLIIIFLLLTVISEAGSIDWARLVISYPPNIDTSLLKGHKIYCGMTTKIYTMEFDLPMPSLVLPLKNKINRTGTYYCVSRGYFTGNILYKQSSPEISFYYDIRVPKNPALI